MFEKLFSGAEEMSTGFLLKKSKISLSAPLTNNFLTIRVFPANVAKCSGVLFSKS